MPTSVTSSPNDRSGRAPADDINMAVVRGRLLAVADLRTLPSGGTVAQFDIVTEDGTVPVAWHDPTTAVISLMQPGLRVVVTGQIQRRFFRSGGRTQSRTEVVAARVIPARRAATVRSALETSLSPLLD